MNSKYIHKKGIVYLNQFHVIFCPKYRRKVLTGNVEKDLRNILHEVAEENVVEIKAMEIIPDHVLLFISFDTRQYIHKIIQQFKGRSSRILREKYHKLKSRIPSLWTRSYFCCTVGHILEEAVMKYIEEQKTRSGGEYSCQTLS